MLHITNGSSAAGNIRRSGIPGHVLSWDDVLHEGPVPAGFGLQQLSDVRARFLAECGWGTYADIRREFARRDNTLGSMSGHEETVLWFEHDLYDQLQLIQILDALGSIDHGGARLTAIVIGEFPGIARFKGLGQLDPAQTRSLFPSKRPVTQDQLRLASAAWRAFTSPDPRAIEALLAGDTSSLPFLAGALRRHLEQFPSVCGGLSRTERQILRVAASGVVDRNRLFLEEQEFEERPFMGDTSFWRYVDALSGARVPLLEAFGSQIQITRTGAEALEGRQDHVLLNGIDRWLGGVHLEGSEAAWRWNHERGLLEAAA